MPDTKVQVSCAFCRGTGLSRGAVCQVCREAGVVSLSSPIRRCAFCRGEGVQQRGTTLTCVVCRGVGAVTVEEDAVPCPVCGGTGVEPAVLGESQLPCLACRGRGVISAARAKALPQGKGRRRARPVYGSGKVTVEY